MNSQKESSKVKKELNQIKPKDLFKKLKTEYFIQNIFDKLLKKKVLEIIKYNKRQQKLLNITIKDYKEYSEKYSSIIIEIKPVKNKYGNFIDFHETLDKFFHIYFNNSNKKINRLHLNKDENVSNIKVIIDYPVKELFSLFFFCDCVESISFKRFNRNNITNMSCMFMGCSSLKNLDLRIFNTDNVTNMSSMFYECFSLKELDLSNFNTNNVTDMRYMFCKCASLTELNLNNFNTNNVNDMQSMFFGCSSLIKLNISNFNTEKVIYMNNIFSECSSLEEVNINNFVINNETDVSNMFTGCSDEFKKKMKSQYKYIKEEAFK